jgi:hypothetical protein
MAREFEELTLDRHNYLTLALDVKISLAFHGILPALSPLQNEKRHFWIHSNTKPYSSSKIISNPT